MDESGISIVPPKLDKVICPVGKQKIQKRVAKEKGETVSIAICMSATGYFIPPALIIPRVRRHSKYYVGAPAGTLELCNETGYMKSDLFVKWIEHFFAYAKPTRDFPVLLLLDNHSSHVNIQVIDFCQRNNIHLLTLPPHTTHALQPLDVAFFGPFKRTF